MEKKVKVVWLCTFMNDTLRKNIPEYISPIERLLRKISRRPNSCNKSDFGIWMTNAIEDAEKRDDLEVTVIFPYSHLPKKIYKFDSDNVHYIAFKSESDYTFDRIKTVLWSSYSMRKTYSRNRKLICEIISTINPDVVHCFGAENFDYSLSLLDLKGKYKTIIQLQTLLNDPVFSGNYLFSEEVLSKKRANEIAVLNAADYIGCMVDSYRSIISKHISSSDFIDTKLAIAPRIYDVRLSTKYDCVYFAADISKAFDVALEVFGQVHKKLPEATMLVVGGYSDSYMSNLVGRIEELGVKNNITFTGILPSHDDVIDLVRTAKVALLPLKVDIVSSTIREAMACGLPTVSTITPGTPKMNEEGEVILLSECQDVDGLSEHVTSLLTDSNFYERYSKNALEYIQNHFSNEKLVNDWVNYYKKIISE